MNRERPVPTGLGRFVVPKEGNGSDPLGVLKRFTRRAPDQAPGETCEMCSEPIPEEHQHVVHLEDRSLLCTCRGCYLLFTREGAAQGKYRAVPSRYLYDPSFALTAAQWDQIQIPVQMAFFFFNTQLERFVAFYPSPGGPTESLLDLTAWSEVLADNPAMSQIAPDVEALLVSRTEGGFECFLVPIDACYELVGRVRMKWKGFDGGEEVWTDIEAFLGDLREKSQTVEGAP